MTSAFRIHIASLTCLLLWHSCLPLSPPSVYQMVLSGCVLCVVWCVVCGVCCVLCVVCFVCCVVCGVWCVVCGVWCVVCGLQSGVFPKLGSPPRLMLFASLSLDIFKQTYIVSTTTCPLQHVHYNMSTTTCELVCFLFVLVNSWDKLLNYCLVGPVKIRRKWQWWSGSIL